MSSTANCLQSVADPTRLRILRLLMEADLTVAELQEILEMGQSRISTHLAKLRRAELVAPRKAGKHTFYALCGGAVWDRLAPLVEAGAGELSSSGRDHKALRLAVTRRQDRAREYFNQLAGKFGRSYIPGRTWRALSMMLLDLLPPMVIADLGAGEGTLSQLLARRAKKVIAVDNSEKMVEFGMRIAAENGFDNLEYRLGDIEDPPIGPGSVDLAILSQALHHAVNPANTLSAAFRILKPGGRLSILDLAKHQFGEARELYADTWLGFAEVDLVEMLEAAGFVEVQADIVSRDGENPRFQTVLASARKP